MSQSRDWFDTVFAGIIICLVVSGCINGSTDRRINATDAKIEQLDRKTDEILKIAKKFTAAAPARIKIPLEEPLRSQINAALAAVPEGTVRLTIRGIVPPRDREVVSGISVFLNCREANSETSTSSPNFVGTREFNQSETQAFNINLTPALLALRNDGKLELKNQLWITLVAYPAKAEVKIPKDFSISFGEVTVTVPKAKGGPWDK
jgi:hypothetical protein